MNLEELEQIAATELEAREKVKHEVKVCMAAGCLSCQSQGVKDALRSATEAAAAQGVVGVPSVVVGDQVFWGDDKLHDAAEVAAAGR